MGDGAETLWGVVIGALLATVGGFAATQIEHLLRRRERERSAALLFGEILVALDLTIRIADETRGRGDPYGHFTMRLLRAVRREAETYDRNREQLYDLRDARTRAQIHGLMVRITLALEGIADSAAQVASLEAATRALSPEDPLREDLASQIAAMADARHVTFGFMVDAAQQIKPIVTTLRPLAKQAFDEHEALLRG
ncbi:hypothetical protein [Phenylobacterium sp.]|uniref:hypothetical protein n=1 Tax=Phenylobacterium sp. TaxID=1871053 RepID=UPI003568E358